MKIFCVGRNYVAHARELGNEVPDAPVIFMKPPTAILRDGKPLYYPAFTNDLQYEGELVVKISKNGKSIQPRFATNYFDEVSIGFDMTARDIQSGLKTKGLPWEIAKGFDGSAPLGKFVNYKEALNERGEIVYHIYKNGEQMQEGNTACMIFPVTELITYISTFFTLQKGDLIYTGTPAGVGPVSIGDRLTGSINGVELIKLNIK